MADKETADTRRYSRRMMLKAVGGAGIGIALAACGGNTSVGGGNTPTTGTGAAPGGTTTATSTSAGAMTPAGGATTGTTAAASGQSGTASGGVPQLTIKIPPPKVKLPTEDVTFRWMDSNNLKAMFERPFFDAYHKAHPNITIHYDGTNWDQINEVIPLGIRNNTAPDMFQPPNNIPHAQVVKEGWVAPLDDIVPDFKQWKAAFPQSTFIPGVTVFNGKTYTYPVTSTRYQGSVLYYSVDLLQKAGYDPSSKPLTWDEFRAAAKKITQQGKGQSYGFIAAGDSMGGTVTGLASLAGAPGGGFDYKTGHYNYNAPEYLDAIQLLLAMKSDGSFFPGFISLSGAEARQRMPQRVAGMIFDGIWSVPIWNKTPGFKFDAAPYPIPKDKKPLAISFEEGGSTSFWVYSKSKYHNIAGDILSYMGSIDGQVEMVIGTKGGWESLIPEANERAKRTNLLDPISVNTTEIFDKWRRMQPVPQVRNPEEAQVTLEMKAVHPDLDETIQGILTGQVQDAKKALQDLNDSEEANLDQAIKAAQDKGADVSRDDWKFPNWDPTKDYTSKYYDELKK